jgi:hypothetical protein
MNAVSALPSRKPVSQAFDSRSCRHTMTREARAAALTTTDCYALPSQGILVAMTVRNWTLASSGSEAM